MSRTEMENKVATFRGLEDEVTIWFCHLAENDIISDETVTLAMVVALNIPFENEK